MRQSYTTLAVPVHEAMFIQPFRTRHIVTPAATLPPHVTVHAPFKDVEVINQAVLDELKALIGSHPQFQFVLHKIGRFSDIDVLYLVPEPVAPFYGLSQSIQSSFVDTPPQFAHPVFHLTIAHDGKADLDHIEEKFHDEYQSRLPIEARATEVCLYEKREGVWLKHTSFALSSNQTI